MCGPSKLAATVPSTGSAPVVASAFSDRDERIDRRIFFTGLVERGVSSVTDSRSTEVSTTDSFVPGVPEAVSINEAIELAKGFGGEEAGGFVNGVLDAVRRSLDASAAAQLDESPDGAPSDAPADGDP